MLRHSPLIVLTVDDSADHPLGSSRLDIAPDES
jgi:hypothetical protein